MTFTERLRPTIRVRLTLLYGGLFLIGGIVLLGLTYFLVKNSLPGGEAIERQLSSQGAPVPEKAMTRVPDQDEVFNGNVVKVQKASQQDTLNSLLTQGGIALAVVTAAALGLGWLFADRALRPVHKITETARRVSHSHNLTERIAYAGPRDEVKELADTFDTMLGRLARGFDAQRRFVANASHELRTPLAINRTLVDVAVRRPEATEDVRRLGESLLVVNGRHERLIEGLLTLADSENTVADTTPIDLADVAVHVLDQADAQAITAHRDLEPALTAGDPILIERLAQNIVENAIRHNHDGGELWISTSQSNGHAELIVANTGPVVPRYDLEKIFEPFQRLGTERVRSDRGSGLGLSIVRATATAHNGTVSAKPRRGGGLTVTVRLPTQA